MAVAALLGSVGGVAADTCCTGALCDTVDGAPVWLA